MTILLDPQVLPARRAAAVVVPPAGALPPTRLLLTQGGDARLAIDPRSGLNRYGCGPTPLPLGMAAFGSSTASTISPAGFAAADRLRRRILRLSRRRPAAAIYADEAARLRRRLIELCGLTDVPGLAAILAASGTDLHLLVVQLARGAHGLPLLSVITDPAETGSGVPAALAGRHFSTITALGTAVAEGQPVAGGVALEVVSVACRAGDGAPRPAAAVDAEVEALVSRAVAAGRRVLLTVTDLSKTGLICPSLTCALALQRRWPDAVTLLVDACQFRLSAASLGGYLQQGCMVALTGSKFLTGPAFAGALLVPPALARRFAAQPLPPSLSAYSTPADWPAGWAAVASLRSGVNFGLLLRWQAALEEFRALRALPGAVIGGILAGLAAAIQARLAADPAFEPLPVPPLDRTALGPAGGWDRVQTIFPFLLRRRAGGLLGREATASVHRRLALEPDAEGGRTQLGQPVPCGSRAAVPLGALRLCASARLVVEAAAGGRDGVAAIVERAMRALDRTAHLASEAG